MSDLSSTARALAIIEGSARGDDIEWLRRGFARAFADGVPLELALGLPATLARRRAALRDHWLERAAAACTEREPWAQACELARAGRVFASRIWPKWRSRSLPPDGASELEIAMFWLHRAGGRVPRERRVFDLIAETVAAVAPDIAVEAPVGSTPCHS